MDLHTLMIIIHIALGCVGIIVGTIIFWKKKGTGTHKKLGHYYIYAMVGCTLLGIWLSYVKGDLGFLISYLIALLLIVSGWLDIKNKGDHVSKSSSEIAILFFIAFLSIFIPETTYTSKMPLGLCVLFLGFSISLCSLYWFEYNFIAAHAAKMIGSYFVLSAGFAVNSLQSLITVNQTFWVSAVFVTVIFPVILYYLENKNNK